jgi:Ser/Thr protein kinase RdoA (MazF antagonist)
VVVAQAPGVPGARRCVLFRWLPGRVIDDRETPAHLQQLGASIARMHTLGRTLSPPTTLRCWDRAFYWDEPVVLSETAAPLTHDDRMLLERVQAHVDEAIGRLHLDDPPFVVHGDLHGGNVMEHRGRLTIFDFEDIMLANAAQDLSIVLYGPHRYRTDDYADLRSALRNGYESVAPWPVPDDRALEMLFAARAAMFVNYCVRTGGDLLEAVPGLLERIHNWERGDRT